MHKIFVSGGGGFIASHVIEELESKGYKVVTNMRYLPSEPLYYLKDVDVYFVDNRDEIGIRQIIEKVDGVINLAGILGTKNVKDWKTFYENNVFGSWSVMNACMTYGTPMVQIAVGNHFETNLYSNTKTAVERDVIMNAKYNGLKANVVRGLNAYGERQKVKNTGKIIPTFVTNALEDKPIPVYGGKDKCGIMDMIYVKDLASILVEVLELTDTDGYQNQVFEAGSGVGYSTYDIAQLIVELTGSKSKIQEPEMRKGESNRSEVVAQNPYPFEYTKLVDGLVRTIDYYKNL